MSDDVPVPTKNLTAFLLMLRQCEGTYDPAYPESMKDGYRALFGYHPVSNPRHLFVGFAQHPNVMQPFTDKRGRRLYTTCAGAYQFIFGTWKRLQNKLGLEDFGPDCQDLAAMELLCEHNAMALAKSGNVLPACERLGTEWASLPTSNYAQPRRSVAFVLAAYIDSGGTLA